MNTFTPTFQKSLDGIILIDKPSGPTSHDVVAAIRHHFRLEKVGHAGTLDPQATGLLIIMTGRGTKLANALLAGDKSYEGVLRLGVATDTQDAAGKVIAEGDYRHVTREQLDAVMQSMTGDMLQTPPMVSAVKIKGVPLYKLARKGQTVERKPKLIHIREFVLKDYTPPRASFHLACSKGVYVRTLCADIGERLQCGGHLESLRRLQSGAFSVTAAITLPKLLEMNRAELTDIIIPIHRVAQTLQPRT